MGLVFALAFDKGVLAELLKTPALQRIGDWSYAIYLGQTAWLGLSRQAAAKPRPDDGAMKLRPENVRTSRQAAAAPKH